MKKILIPVLLGLLCAPVGAIEPSLHELVREMGYEDDYIVDNLPPEKAKPKLAPAPSKPAYVEPTADLMQPEDLLHPRVFQKSESPEMIPVLMRYHRANPTSEKITRKLAVTCLKSGQHREALYWYIQTFQRDRSDFESLWNMAAISYNLGETAQTRKYLTEYTKLDPNSAWGRMAREFLAGRFSGSDLSDGFAGQTGRIGLPAGGMVGPAGAKKSAGVTAVKPAAGAETGSGIMVVEGKRYDVETFVSIYDEDTEIEKPTKLNDTLKGKSGARSSDKKAGKKLSLENAVIADKLASAPEDVAGLKTTAPPLTPTK